MKNSICILIVLSFHFHFSWSQNEIIENLDFERVIEDILPQQEMDIDYNDLYDRLFTLYTNPINLNYAERTEFQSLFFLSEEQISGIINYRKEYGKFLTAYELLTIEGFNKETVQRISSFVTVSGNETEPFKKSIKNPDHHDLFLRYQTSFEQKKGYSAPDTTNSGELTSRYAGGPERPYARYLFSKSDRYSFGFTIEKDPGEKIIWSPQTARYGLDYYSFHAMIENRGVIKKIILGDFSMDYGQGLIFGSGLRFGKGVEPVTTIRRNNLGLRPYRSVFENRDFSGFAISTSFSHIELNMFYSFVKRDAAIKEGTISEVDQYISSIQTIGLHRTQSEIDAKNQLTDQTFGANLSFKPFNNNLELGLNGVFSNYSLPLLPNTRKYNQFDFAGLNNHLGGFYINYFLKKAHFFGEFAFSKSGGKAISSGIIASLSSQVQASLHIRKHEKDFHSFYGAAFGENTKIGNENGIYWGLKISPLQRLIITTYLDVFVFPWLKYQVDAPSKGNDFMISAIYTFTPKLNFRIQYRSKLKEMNYNIEDTPQVQILPKVTKRLLLNMGYLLSDFFSIQTRIQQSSVNFNNSNSNGFMIAQDINFQRQNISISARFALFDTDNYDSRQYIYERDLLYLYSIPSFYNRGIRYFLLMKYKLWKNVDLWLKISQTKYTDQESIGTGLEKIDCNRRTNLNAQIRIKL